MNNIPIVQPHEAAARLFVFAEGFREQLRFLDDVRGDDPEIVRLALYKRSIVALIEQLLPEKGRTRNILLKAAAFSPEETLASLANDARRINRRDVIEKIGRIRQTLSPAEFRKLSTRQGMEVAEPIPTTFWVQLRKNTIPMLRIWSGVRLGACSEPPFPRTALKAVSALRQKLSATFPEADFHLARASFESRVHALSLTAEFRMFIPFSEEQRIRYETTGKRTGHVNGMRTTLALGSMLHEIVCPLGFILPTEPVFASALVRDASPLAIPL